MHFNILTLFPEVFEPYLNTSIVGRAREKKLISTQLYNIRDFATDRHKTVDDTPYGGGAGMIMKIEPIDNALQSIPKTGNRKTIVLSAGGTQFTQLKAKEFSQLDSLTLICGRYEGIDQRVADNLADEELSVGPYVLAGGELPAMIITEAVSRLIPGVLGNPKSLIEESHNQNLSSSDHHQQTSVTIEYPQYTKPEVYKDWKVPDVLLSGNHASIFQWRNKNSQSS